MATLTRTRVTRTRDPYGFCRPVVIPSWLSIGTQYLKTWTSVFVIVNTQEYKPYRIIKLHAIWYVCQSPFSTLVSNELLQNPEFFRCFLIQFRESQEKHNLHDWRTQVSQYRIDDELVFSNHEACMKRGVLLSPTSMDGSILTLSAVRSDS
ncbi:hypothetical protein EDB84DRAFT_938450 [Lactarius hengduanensis]|nr:hypothetical protein EDB84DRAFT_938450 [Lactarius hengduanensis]